MRQRTSNPNKYIEKQIRKIMGGSGLEEHKLKNLVSKAQGIFNDARYPRTPKPVR